MKTITIPPEAADINSLLEEARRADIVVRAADGAEFMLTAIDEFDAEIARTRRNEKLMALLDERARRPRAMSLGDVKRELGLSGE